MNTEKSLKISEYNDEPVYYCKQCLSLKVRFVPGMRDSDYCDECGSTDVGKCSIEEWEQMFKERYGYNHLKGYKN